MPCVRPSSVIFPRAVVLAVGLTAPACGTPSRPPVEPAADDVVKAPTRSVDSAGNGDRSPAHRGGSEDAAVAAPKAMALVVVPKDPPPQVARAVTSLDMVGVHDDGELLVVVSPGRIRELRGLGIEVLVLDADANRYAAQTGTMSTAERIRYIDARKAEARADPKAGPAEHVPRRRPPLTPTSTVIPAGAGYPPRLRSEDECNRRSVAAAKELYGLDAPCDSAADCELVASVCPFGCALVLSKRADRGRAKAAIRRYFAGCRACKNKCQQPPPALACTEGRCVEDRSP